MRIATGGGFGDGEAERVFKVMSHEDPNFARAMVGEYVPIAVYYAEADIVEYVRADVPAVHRRVDDFLTLILDLGNREPIGFALKGFRNYYLKHIRPEHPDTEFLLLTKVLEEAVSGLGSTVFENESLHAGYRTAREIASTDNVELHELPEAA
jgi:hypothetical protein